MLLEGPVRRRFIGGVVVLGPLAPAVVVTSQVIGLLGGDIGAAVRLMGAIAAAEVGGYFLRDVVLRVGVYGPPKAPGPSARRLRTSAALNS